MPVNLRTADDRGPDELGNHFGLVFAPLRTDDCAASDRIRSTKTAMDHIKASHEADVVFGALNAMGHTPTQVAQAWSDSFSQRASAVVTNIVGPRTPVTFAGAPVSQVVVFVPSTGPLGIGVSFLSYAGAIAVGVITDEAIVPDATALLRDLTAATAELTAPLSRRHRFVDRRTRTVSLGTNGDQGPVPMSLHGGVEIIVGLVLIGSGGLLLAFHRRIETRYDRIGGFADRKSPRWVRAGMTIGGGAFLILLGALAVIGGMRPIPR